MKSLVWVFALIALLGVAAQACGSKMNQSNDPILGTYEAEVTAAAIQAAGGGVAVVAAEEGAWQLEFTKEGQCRLIRLRPVGGPMLEEEVPFHLSGDTLVLEPRSGELGCFPSEGQGTYRWKLEGEQLTLTAIEDHCYRQFALTVNPWIKTR